MQGEEWDDSMTSVRRIVPKTNEQYVELLKKLIKLITKNETIQSQVVKTLYRKIQEHCGQKKFRKESIYPFIAPSLGTTLLLSSTIFMFLLGIK